MSELNTNETRGIVFDLEKKIFPIIICAIGFIVMLVEWIAQLNLITLVSAIYLMVVALIMCIGVLKNKRLYGFMFFGYCFVLLGILGYNIVAGADAGWGAFMSGKSGYVMSEWFQGEGNFFTRLLGNIVLTSPIFAVGIALVVVITKVVNNPKVQKGFGYALSILLIFASIANVFLMNLRTNPNVFDMSKGHDDYLNSITGNTNKKNVIVILMDDMGYGDAGFNTDTSKSITPCLDNLATSDDSIIFDNFYSSYSVCSPSRFACLTGRYPYRGYADNVMYPTVNTTSKFPATRVYNSFEMGNNVDGLLGDEITIAETLSKAGYQTGAFAKWHLGDYGQYLPTNQGFDYFYGSYHVNDMYAYYLAEEFKNENGDSYKIINGMENMDQGKTSERVHNKVINWLDSLDDSNPFFMYYATPWPHAPVFAGDLRSVECYNSTTGTDTTKLIGKGATGLGTYADCLNEFDYYVGELVRYLKDNGLYDNTTIIFTSDNGPALEGSAADLRGGKYTAYEAGQKMPFFITNSGYEDIWNSGEICSTPVTMVDLYPTIVEMLGVQGNYQNKAIDNFLPSCVDREIDGRSFVKVLDKTTNYIHDKSSPILHMKREKINAIQYSVDSSKLKDSTVYNSTLYPYVTFKYFKNVPNDNPAFFDKRRKNWLINLTVDKTESYNVRTVYPEILEEYSATLNSWTKKFKENRRGILNNYYGDK